MAGGLNFFLSKLNWTSTQILVMPISVVVSALTGYIVIRLFNLFQVLGSKDFLKKILHFDYIKRIIENTLNGIQDLIPAIFLPLLIMVTFYLAAGLIGWVKPERYQSIFSIIALKFRDSIFASLQEENLFRLFLMSGLTYCLGFIFQKKVAIASALVVTSLLFALFHFNLNQLNISSWAHYLLYITVGLILGYSFILTKTLWFPLGFHFSWDFFLGLLPLITGTSLQDSSKWYYLLGELVVCLCVTTFYVFNGNAYKIRRHWLW
jgi:membrane protease YdiL (CAAX protease family)